MAVFSWKKNESQHLVFLTHPRSAATLFETSLLGGKELGWEVRGGVKHPLASLVTEIPWIVPQEREPGTSRA